MKTKWKSWLFFALWRLVTLAAASALPGSILAYANEKPFPPQILAAKTIAVVAHYGSIAAASNPAKELKFKNDAQAALKDSGRFTVLEDPAKSDIVLLVIGGYSEGFLGFKDHIAIAAIFFGGTQPRWNPVPLWITEESESLRRSAAFAATKEFVKDVNRSENRVAGNPGGTDQSTVLDNSNSQDNEGGRAESLSRDAASQWFPAEILNAKKVVIMQRIDPVAGPRGEETEKHVEKEVKKWGRFTVVNDPADADLVFVCIRFLDTWKRTPSTYENLLIFKTGKDPDWRNMPLWTVMQIEALFRPLPGTQMVRWLRKQVEAQEARHLSLPSP